MRSVLRDMARDPFVWLTVAAPQAWLLYAIGARIADTLGIWM